MLDLDAAMKSLQAALRSRPQTTMPPFRQARVAPAEVPCISRRSIDLSGPGLRVGAWIDGVQMSRTVAYLRHRPVILQYASAVAVDSWRDVVDRVDDVRFVCSEVDAPWLGAAIGGEWVHAVPDADEHTIAGAAARVLDQGRRRLERRLSSSMVDQVAGHVIVDGPLTGHPAGPLVGVVKNQEVAYLDPEWHLHELRVGEFTHPAFEIIDHETGEATGRHSAYARLHDHTRRGALHGLIRLEAFDPSLLPALATTCMHARQFSASQDARWDRHLSHIAWAEHMGRHMAPRLGW